MIAFSFMVSSLLLVSSSDGGPTLLRYDKGRETQRRIYRNAEQCTDRPCVLTQHGALRFDWGEEVGRYKISLWLLHRGTLTQIDYLEKRSALDYFLVERMFNRRRNRKIWSLLQRIEEGELDTLYVYGINLQYALDQGDPLIVEITHRDVPNRHQRYYFRFHRSGFRLAFDVALLIPINSVRIPSPDPPYVNSNLNAAATFQIARNKDPEAQYSWFQKILLSGHPTLFLGLLNRKLQLDGEQPKRQSDLFVGAGVTFLDFLFLGWGANVIQQPHTTTPFVGLHIGKAIKFVRQLNRSSPQKWDDYLENERTKSVVREEDLAYTVPPP